MYLIRSLWWLAVWTIIIVLSLYFFMDNVIVFFYGYKSRIMGDSILNNQLFVVMHLVGGTMALLLGPTQFWPFIRNRFLPFHRFAGKTYMVGVALIGISAVRLSLISHCLPCRLSLFLLTVFAVLSTGFAWKAIKAGNTKVHRQMMVRSYICVLAFVSVRIDDIFPLDFLFGNIQDSTLRRVVNEYFFSFVPLLVAEVIMVWVPSVFYKRKKAI